MTRKEICKKYSDKVRTERKAAGLCYECGKCPPHENCIRCQTCMLKQKVSRDKHRNKKKELGLCEKCDNPAKEGHRRCESCLNDQREFAKARNKQLRDEAVEAYGGYKCVCCHTTYRPCLELDHVNGGGNKHRMEVSGRKCGSVGMYHWLKKNNYPVGLMQVLCASCNRAKSVVGKCGCQEHLKQQSVA